MKTIDEIRRENVGLLIEESGGSHQLADKLKKSPAQISQWLNGSKDSKSGKPRGMSSETAREIEAGAKKERGWMDNDHSDIGVEQFRKLPPEVRAWMMRKGNNGDEHETKPNGTK